MGLDLQLYDDRPYRSKRGAKRGPTLIRESHEHGEALSRLIEELPAHTSLWLGTVYPYSDTVFNEQVAESALREIPGLLDRCTDEAQTAAVHDLAALLRECATTPGSRLVFVGD
ncbi:hypothetical protein [Streptomyces resistomycificus]|uniref:Uncharacterized protein n=1 Tax=Streptomyces resistomycificus TaxID=67356 RepID=A0A0L8KWY4_9ACTN|nr:hypothetical protein [Streptomyces resistomycificus]KOG30451.1 hypothetical protein ADK37_34705 [Streptomyces resistomycificus]KUN91966.1 hypothetical protein AQJ84_34850 [Streptomyces resistomycificus]